MQSFSTSLYWDVKEWHKAGPGEVEEEFLNMKVVKH